MLPKSTDIFIFGSSKFLRSNKNRLYQKLYHKNGIDPVNYSIERCRRILKKHRFIDKECLSRALIAFKTIRLN